jgi:hypothetical protein
MNNRIGSLGSSSDERYAFEEASARLVELQLRLMTHWWLVIHAAVERFAAQAESPAKPCLSVDELMKRYEAWIECAEEAYSEAVCGEEYCRLQAELANAALRLLLRVRAEAVASE